MTAPQGRRFACTFAISLVLIVGGCAHTPTSLHHQAIDTGWMLLDDVHVPYLGGAISRAGYDTAGWRPAIVPGTVLTSLVADGIYPEPLYGENNRPDRIPDSLCRSSYWYRTEFHVPPAAKDQHVWLNLDGINYIAEVWINSRLAGNIRGAFARGVFDVTPFVTPGTMAAVAVKIIPPPHPGVPLEQTQKLGAGVNGGVLAKDGPTFVPTIGWDWMPGIRDRDIGIWRDVSVRTTGPVVLRDPNVTSRLPLPRTESADLAISVTAINTSDRRQTGVLVGSIEGARFQQKLILAPHESRPITFSVHLDHPRLWWPNGYGLPELYRLHFELAVGNTLSDVSDTNFGVREIMYQVPGSENLAISVNGVPILCKGGNWGMDEAMKRIPHSRLEAAIRMHQAANLNMIRNWVGQSTGEDFYDLCDRHGILVWDEFFQPNPANGPDPLDFDLYLANVREKVLRFRSHACIALWCGRNEGNPPPEIDAGLRRIMTDLDPGRLYQKNSADGKGVRSSGPYDWRPPKRFYSYPPADVFKTEIGSVSIPTLQAIQAMMPQKDWWPPTNDDWAEHDLCRGPQHGDSYPRILGERYGPSQNLEDFVRKAQLANYETFRAMFEGRFVKLFNPVTGVLTWMSHPAQPSMVWQLYSHDLEPNASYFAVRKACEPLHVMLNQTNDHVTIINATPTTRPGLRVRTRVIDFDGSIAGDETRDAAATGLAATDLGAISFAASRSPVHFVKLELLDASGQVLSDNLYWRTTRAVATTMPASTTASRFPPPEDFTDLQKLSPVPVELTIRRADEAGRCAVLAKITNRGRAVALLTHLQLRNAVTNERILPVYYSDNYVSLLPGESEEIRIETAAPAAQAKVEVDGFNISRED